MLNFSKWLNPRYKYLKVLLSLTLLIFFIPLFIVPFTCFKNKGYQLFVEFSDAYGLKEGVCVTYKGVKVGSVSRIKVYLDKVVILLHITSSKTLVPFNSTFEANQIGLFNDIVISITPNHNLFSKKGSLLKSSRKNYYSSKFLPPNSYIKGYKGISYDDLLRSTTRISQRFDDPRFFSLFYLLLENSTQISDEALLLVYNLSVTFNLVTESIAIVLSRYLF